MTGRINSALAVLAVIAMAAPAWAVPPVIDGSRAFDGYGLPRAIQTVQTDFGDEDGSDNGGDGVGSEMDAAYARIDSGRLYLMLTGNIQPNFNKLEIFIDSKPGGENILSGTPEYDFGNSSQNLGGTTLDAGFTADYHIFARGGDPGGGRNFDVDFINRAGGGSASVAGNGLSVPLSGVQGTASGTITAGDAPAFGNISGPALSSTLEFAFDNSNTAGILGGTGAANQAAAAAVVTGLELSIDLADIGSPAGPFKVMVAQNNDGHNFLSNQTLGGLQPPQGNLGATPIDFTQFPGNQFFIVPEPASVALIGLGAALVMRRSRRA